MNNLLEKADRLYKQLQMNRPALESLLIKVNELGHDRAREGVVIGITALPPAGTPGNKGDVNH